jgi:hypothetical protein
VLNEEDAKRLIRGYLPDAFIRIDENPDGSASVIVLPGAVTPAKLKDYGFHLSGEKETVYSRAVATAATVGGWKK